jgi:hypothetical protein
MKQMMLFAMLLTVFSVQAQVKTEISTFNLTGPYAVAAPLALDTVDAQGKKFDEASLLGAIAVTSPATGKFDGQVIPSLADSKSVGLLSFYVNNIDYLKGKITVKGPKNYKLYIDDKEAGADLSLAPEHHTFAIRYLAEPNDTDSISVSFDTQIAVSPTTDKRHPYMIHDLLDGRRVRGIALSADGSLVSMSYQTTEPTGNSRWDYELREAKNGRLLQRPTRSVNWMPTSTAWLEEEKEQGQRILYKVDPLTGERTHWAAGLPEGSYTVSPTEDYLIITATEDGPKEDSGVFEVTEMDERRVVRLHMTKLSEEEKESEKESGEAD